MKKLYLLEWYLEREEQHKKRLYSSLSEAEKFYYALCGAISAGWVALEELEEFDESKGFERWQTIHYSELPESERSKELKKKLAQQIGV